MRYITSTLLLLTWGLWFGGLIALFFTVMLLFSVDKTLAVQVGPRVFPAFEKLQLVLAGLLLASCFGMRVLTKSGFWTVVLAVVIVAAIPAIVSPLFVTPRLVAIWGDHESYKEEFKKLHGYSMMLYSTSTVTLLLAGLGLPIALKGDNLLGHGREK